MKRLIAAATGCTAMLIAAGLHAQRSERIAVTPEVLLRDAGQFIYERGIQEFAWTADGRGLMVRVVGAPAADAQAPQPDGLQYVDIATGKRVPLGLGSSPRSAPDGELIAIPRTNVFWRPHALELIRRDGVKVCEIVDTAHDPAAAGINAFAWSHDGRRLAVAASLQVAESLQGVDGTLSVKVYSAQTERALQRPDNVIIWSFDRTCGDVRHIATLPYKSLGDLVWLAGDEALATNALAEAPDVTHGRTDILIVQSRTGTWRAIAANTGGQAYDSVVPSPDGSFVAFRYDKEGLPYNTRLQVAVAAVSDGSLRFVSADLRGRPQWLPDGSALLLTALATHPSLEYPVATSFSGVESPLKHLPGTARLSPDGNQMAWTETDLAGASSLWIAAVSSRRSFEVPSAKRRLLDVPAPLAVYRRGARRLLHWSSVDGLRIAGLLVLPTGYVPGQRYPLIVDVHGGPQGGLKKASGSLLNMSTLEWDLWAAKGYAVLVPDYRSSGMYGFHFVDATRTDGSGAERDFEDIMSGVDALIDQGIADRGRMAVIGHSHGGELVNWIVTHSNRFRAAISYEGGHACALLAWAAHGRVNDAIDRFWGSALEHPKRYERQSYLLAARGVMTPALFIAGYEGARPGNLYAWLYAAWRYQGVEAEYHAYADEGHRIEKPANQRHLLTTGVEWIERHLRQTAPD